MTVTIAGTSFDQHEYDEVRVQAEEQYFTGLGADGSAKGGFIRGKLRLSDAGDIVYRLNRFETE